MQGTQELWGEHCAKIQVGSVSRELPACWAEPQARVQSVAWVRLGCLQSLYARPLIPSVTWLGAQSAGRVTQLIPLLKLSNASHGL